MYHFFVSWFSDATIYLIGILPITDIEDLVNASTDIWYILPADNRYLQQYAHEDFYRYLYTDMDTYFKNLTNTKTDIIYQ